jgi:hypothetical protein
VNLTCRLAGHNWDSDKCKRCGIPFDLKTFVKIRVPNDAYPTAPGARTTCLELLDWFVGMWAVVAQRRGFKCAPDEGRDSRKLIESVQNALVGFLLICEKHNARAPLAIMRELTRRFPNSGLAWYCLFCAHVATTGNGGDARESLDAVKKSIELGCDYIQRQSEAVVVQVLQHPEQGIRFPSNIVN